VKKGLLFRMCVLKSFTTS